MRLGELDDQFDLNGRIQWQNWHADCAARVNAGITKHFGQELARAVHDGWLAGEFGNRGHKANDLDHSSDSIQVSDGKFYGCEGV